MFENIKFVYTIPWQLISESQLDYKKLAKSRGIKWIIGLCIKWTDL